MQTRGEKGEILTVPDLRALAAVVGRRVRLAAWKTLVGIRGERHWIGTLLAIGAWREALEAVVRAQLASLEAEARTMTRCITLLI